MAFRSLFFFFFARGGWVMGKHSVRGGFAHEM